MFFEIRSWNHSWKLLQPTHIALHFWCLAIMKIDQMISRIPSSSFILKMAQIGWLFTLHPTEYLEAASNLIFAAHIHTHTLVFHQKHWDFFSIGKLLSLFPFYSAIIYSNHWGCVTQVPLIHINVSYTCAVRRGKWTSKLQSYWFPKWCCMF